MKKLESKIVPFQLTKLDGDTEEEKGTFTGYGSVFGVTDSYADIVLPGAFKKTLKEQKQFPMLWSHYYMEPIGIIMAAEDETGLAVTGKLNLNVQRAREIYALMDQGAVNGLSIGYNVIKDEMDRDSGLRKLKEVRLWEISPCVFQACPGATISDVKSAMQALFGVEPPSGTPKNEEPLLGVKSALIDLNDFIRSITKH